MTASVVSLAEDLKNKVTRPKLPTQTNPLLKDVDEAVVKLQTIKREGHNIIIGRVKLPTVNGQNHAFLLKRFDTNALAASSMFRLAYPFADGDAEAAEMQHLDAQYDTNRANGGLIVEEVKAPDTPKKRGRPKKNADTDTESASERHVKVLPQGSTGVRLQGTWIPAKDAIAVAEEYGIAKFANPLIHATAEHDEAGGVPILTSPATSEVKTPRKRQRISQAATISENEDSPQKVQRVTVSEKADGSISQVNVEFESGSKGRNVALTQADIDAQIAEAKALAAGIQKSASVSKLSPAARGQKRRAVNDRPTADLDLLADDDDYADSGRVTRVFKRSTRAARRRPIATTASVVAAAGAVGAGALAWISGGNADVALQTLQSSLQSIGIQNIALENLGQYGSQIGSQLASYFPW